MFNRSRKHSNQSQDSSFAPVIPFKHRSEQDSWSKGVPTKTHRSYFGADSFSSATADSKQYPQKLSSISAGNLGSFRGRSGSSTSTVNTIANSIRRASSTNNNAMATTAERSRTRRERTFVGSECAVCEEPLEHTLRGERILQFSCSHVSHEACFYEYVKDFDGQYCPTCDAPLHLDTSRGNVIDVEKITNMVRSTEISSAKHTPSSTWDSRTVRPDSVVSGSQKPVDVRQNHTSQAQSIDRRDSTARSTIRTSPDRPLRESQSTGMHGRSDSEATGLTSNGYPETMQSGPQRRHDYDLQAMETSPVRSQSIARSPIAAPIVTVRSEFPTVNRSRQQQTLTCLVTIEVPDNNWRPSPHDLGSGTTQPSTIASRLEEDTGRPASPARTTSNGALPSFHPPESTDHLRDVTDNLRNRVDNWHGLDFNRFGNLRLYGTLRVGKDKASWQELECYFFPEMLICVKEKRLPQSSPVQYSRNGAPVKTTKCTLKGAILIKRQLTDVTETGNIDENILTLSLSVQDLPQFHLRFETREQLKIWNRALLHLHAPDPLPARVSEPTSSENEDDAEWHRPQTERVSSTASSWGPKSVTTAPTEYTSATAKTQLPTSIHVPIDVVVVVPISSSMQGIKINLVRDALRFMVNTLGERDRMGLVTFGSGGGGVPVVGMTTKAWPGWTNIMSSIKPVGQKSHRADVVEGANVAMDLLMQRKHNNPIATIMLISDASTSDADSVDFVVSRAEAAKITIYSFGLGMTHKPDTMIELSTRTKASYTYVKDWMMLRECLAGCLGAMQTLSHQNVKLKLKLPEGSPAKFHKISGALQITKRATGRDAEASLGDLRFGEKRDILVQLVILPEHASPDQLPQDPWDNIVSGLEALGGDAENDGERSTSVEEIPLVQADLTWSDILRDGITMHMPRPSLLAITMLPSSSSREKPWAGHPPIPPHPMIVQRRMELLTSDMLTRALTLVGRGQHDRAHTLLHETRTILKGLGKGGLPPVPPQASRASVSVTHPATDGSPGHLPDRKYSPSPQSSATSTAPPPNALTGNQLGRSKSSDVLSLSSGIDAATVAALDHELESSLEWINHPAVFGRDSRKAVLQAIGVISSQRAFTFRTPVESLWAGRVWGVRRLTERSKEWREEGGGEGGITEET